MTSSGRYETRELLRWGLSAVVIVAAHAGAAAALMTWPDRSEPGEPPAALVIELAALPVAVPSEPVDIAPGPEQAEAITPNEPEKVETPPDPEPPPPTPQEKTEVQAEETARHQNPQKTAEVEPEEPQKTPPPAQTIELESEDIPPVPEAEVAVAALVPTPRPAAEPPKPRPQAPAQIARAPKPIQQRVAARPVAPSIGTPTINSNAIPTWRSRLVSHLERHKRYPPEARSGREQGVAVLSFRIDRGGNVLSSRVARSSGSAALDRETLALVRRASPMPAPPPEVRGPHIDLTVPVRFDIR